jgi:hypothetical protein
MKNDIIINEENFKKFSKKLKNEINNLDKTDIILSESKEILSRVFFRSSYHEIKRNFKEDKTSTEELLLEDEKLKKKENDKKIKILNKHSFELLDILDSKEEVYSYLLFSVKNGQPSITIKTYKHNIKYGSAKKNYEKEVNKYTIETSKDINKTFNQDNLRYFYQCLFSEAAVSLDFSKSQNGTIELIKEDNKLRLILKNDTLYNPFSQNKILDKKIFHISTLADIDHNSYYFVISKNNIDLENMILNG